jgi:hypothetical protein
MGKQTLNKKQKQSIRKKHVKKSGRKYNQSKGKKNVKKSGRKYNQSKGKKNVKKSGRKYNQSKGKKHSSRKPMYAGSNFVAKNSFTVPPPDGLTHLSLAESLVYVQMPYSDKRQYVEGLNPNIKSINDEVCLYFEKQDFSFGVQGGSVEGMNAFSSCKQITFYDCYFPVNSPQNGEDNRASIRNVETVKLLHCRKVDNLLFLALIPNVIISQYSSIYIHTLPVLSHVHHLELSFCLFYKYFKISDTRFFGPRNFNMDNDVKVMFVNLPSLGPNASKTINLTYSELDKNFTIIPPDTYENTRIGFYDSINLSHTCIENIDTFPTKELILNGCPFVSAEKIEQRQHGGPPVEIIHDEKIKNDCLSTQNHMNEKFLYETNLEEMRNVIDPIFDPIDFSQRSMMTLLQERGTRVETNQLIEKRRRKYNEYMSSQRMIKLMTRPNRKRPRDDPDYKI